MKARIVLLATLAALLSSARVSAEDWPQLQHDAARTGRTPDVAVPPYRARWIWLGPELTLRNKDAKPGGERWTNDLTPKPAMRLPLPTQMAFSFAGSMQPIVLAGRIYVADAQGKAYAVNQDDGTTLWQADNPGGSLWPGVAADKVVAFASLYGFVTGYDAATGKQLWQIDTGRSITAAPALLDGVVYLANQTGVAYAIQLADGKQLWKSEPLGAPIQGGLCIANGKIYLGTEAMEALALDAKSGKVLARQKLTGQSFRFVWPVAAKDHIIFTTVGLICPGSEYVNDDVIGKGRKLEKWPDKPGYPDAKSEEEAMLAWMAGKGSVWEETYALNPDTLKKDYIIATGATEGCGAAPNPPAIDAQDRPLLWWATGYPTLTSLGSFGTHFSLDISSFDLATGRRILINPGRLSGQSTETDNLFGLAVGGDWVYLRQSFRGTAAINLKTGEQKWVSKTVHEDGQSNAAAVYYGSSSGKGADGEPIRNFMPKGPAGPHGRVAPTIVAGQLLFTETFGALTCVETAK